MKLFFIIIVLSILFNLAYAGYDGQQLTISIGMVNASYTEKKSSLETPAKSTALASGAASVLPVDFLWEFYQSSERSYFARVTAPLLTSSQDSYFSINAGANWYIKSLSTTGEFRDPNDTIAIIPKIRYYWGFGMGTGYLVYTTKAAKKSDLLADLSLHGGIIYSINSKWGMRAETGYARALGVATTTSIIRAFIGFTRDINTFF